MVMVDPEPVLLFWGAPRTVLYNERFIPLLAKNHPCMGQSAFQALPEYSDFLCGIFDRVDSTGKSFVIDDLPIFLQKEDAHHEGYVCLRYIPILASNGEVVAILHRGHYSTHFIQHTRRLDTFVSLTLATNSAKRNVELWHKALTALGANKKDFMFGLLYTPGEPVNPEEEKQPLTNKNLASRCLVLRAAVGIPDGHPFAAASIRDESSPTGFFTWFRTALETGRPIVLSSCDGTMPEKLLKGIKSGDYGESCRAVVVAPLRPSESQPVTGFMIVSADPRTPMDEKYMEFIDTITAVIGSAMGSLVTIEEELTRVEEAAQAEKTQLFQQLKDSKKEIKRQEKLSRHFVERSAAGIFIIKQTGEYIYRNKGWYDMFQTTFEQAEPTVRESWEKYGDPDSFPSFLGVWEDLSKNKKSIHFEFKLRRSWEPTDEPCDSPSHDREHRVWLLAVAFPDLDEMGEITQILGYVTDISALKRVQWQQSEHAALAVESKQRLENFIDATNHELRNPLSAVILSSDGIIHAVSKVLENYEDADAIPDKIRQLLNEVMNNAKTIGQCAQHQNRIVNDVLTASKLDSRLLEVTPEAADPSQELLRCIKVFEGDAFDANVEVILKPTPSFMDMEKTLFMFDPTRFIQVFMNLLTNAIKFTRFEQIKVVTVRLDVTTVEPLEGENMFKFITPEEPRSDPTTDEHWGCGPIVYVIVKVHDTGRGLTPDEQEKLFMRFSQASPKTHIHYGGSGLGLYISRRLSELQGGAIGFTSERGVGSTFAFYIKTRAAMSRKSSIAEQARDLKTAKAHIPTCGAPRRRSSGGKEAHEQAILDSPEEPPETRAPASLAILIVEDNLINQKTLAKQLQRLGCEVSVANHGQECLEQIGKTKWSGKTSTNLSVVLMDWEMPVMDGLTCARRIRQMEKEGLLNGHVPVIGVTANARAAQLEQAIGAGMDDVVSKPFRLPDLMAKINALLDRLEDEKKDLTLSELDEDLTQDSTPTEASAQSETSIGL